METRCARCGKDPADGLASIGDDRYCHGGDIWQSSTARDPSCYELASWDNAAPLDEWVEVLGVFKRRAQT